MLKVLILAALATLASSHGHYSGHQVISVAIPDLATAKLATNLVEDRQKDFEAWNEARVGGELDIMARSKDQVEDLTAQLDHLGLEHRVKIGNLQALVDLERIPAATGNGLVRQGGEHNLTFDQYHPVEVFHEYFDYLEGAYDFVSTEVIGQSYEGRDLKIVKVCKGGCGGKYVMWIDAGIHAREWIAPATAMYITQELVENDAAHPDLTENLDWYILPSVNPDGYAFSMDEVVGDRLWRMTRRPNQGGCIGADPNRNWDFHWDEGGSSDIPCDPRQTYHGDFPFSEPDVEQLTDYLFANRDLVLFYNAMHSYGQFILLPWGFPSPTPAPGFDEMKALAEVGVEALTAVHGTQFQIDTIVNLVGVASGGSVDWVPGVAEIPFACAMELRDQGQFGFVLPPEQIVPVGEEAWEYHAAVARDLFSQYGLPN